MGETLVRFDGVRKTYGAGGPAAVVGLDLDIARGELMTLLGPSGSGKTTTLMMLAGFETPSAGRILLEGRNIAHTAPHRRGIGVVFQSYALFPHMTVAENVAFPLSVRGVGRAEREARVAKALDMVRLGGFGERRPVQLSGGQQQRVALARAMVFEPPIVLLDEPLGALDKALREEMQLEIRHIHQRLGVTMMYVTHDQAEALTLSDRIAVFEGGRVRQVADPKRLYDRPADAFVAGFVGENNLLRGVITARDGDEVTVRLACGPVIAAQAADCGQAGEGCLVAIRPERIAVAAVAAADMGEGALPAVLQEAIFLGDHVRLRLSMGDGGEMLAKRPAGVGTLPEPGGPAAIAWPEGAAFAFREPPPKV
jgi:putative spermidine/putrescine transport system ATP-binding protein